MPDAAHPKSDPFKARQTLDTPLGERTIYRLDACRGVGDIETLPYCIKVLLEACLRNLDGYIVTEDHVKALAAYDPKNAGQTEIPFMPGRVVLQDFTGVPAVVDLAAMRDGIVRMTGDEDAARKVNPLVPCDLVIDHSVQVDAFASGMALTINSEKEFERNQERYELLKWAQDSFNNFRVVPPATGIVHQVNLEYLAKVVWDAGEGAQGPRGSGAKGGASSNASAPEPLSTSAPSLYPDSLVGTDSHTTMINGLGVLGWGVGGIEAEAVMLGQPIYMLIPEVVGFRLTGRLPEGATATDLVLKVTQMLRKHGVVGRFVEFFGPGLADMPLANRATIANMAPEYGATTGFFPVDEQTLKYLHLTGRDEKLIDTVEQYCREQGLWRDENRKVRYTSELSLDMSEVEPALAGPKRPQDRIALSDMQRQWRRDLEHTFGRDTTTITHNPVGGWVEEGGQPAGHVGNQPNESYDSKPEHIASQQAQAGSDTLTAVADPEGTSAGAATSVAVSGTRVATEHVPARVELDGHRFKLHDGAVVIAAITSCTNTSNPSVMVGAGLVARKARAKGLTRKPWVKTSLAPGSKVVTEYLDKAGLTEDLNALGFHLVGYGCTTCIGNSGPLPEPISRAINDHGLVACSVLSGNRNFEGRISPDVKANYLASPPLVVAYALAGSVDIDLGNDSLGQDRDGNDVYLRDLWPTQAEVDDAVAFAVTREQFVEQYAHVFEGSEEWRAIDVATGRRFAWNEKSTYVQEPPFFMEMKPQPEPTPSIRGARCLGVFGDSVTTDHISPAGSIKKDSPAGRFLQENDVPVSQFNSYGSRRGNDRVMTRGTFANIRVQNLLAPGTEGGVTTYLGEDTPDAGGSRQPDAPRADDCRPQHLPDVDDPNVVSPGVQPEELPGTPGKQDDSAGGRHKPDITGEAEPNEGTDGNEADAPAPSRKGDGKDHPPAGAGGYDNADPTATDPRAKPAPPHAPNAPEAEAGDPDHPTTVGSSRGAQSGAVVDIFDAAVAYSACQTSERGLSSKPESRPGFTPLIVLAGKDYGMGSSRDWAAKGTLLLGVRAVIAESYERIHRSNLVGMGVLPLQFAEGEGRESLGLTGRERFDIDIPNDLSPGQTIHVTAHDEQGDGKTSFTAVCRIDTPVEVDYYRNGGILHTVLRRMAQD